MLDFIIEFIIAYILVDAVIKIGRDFYNIGCMIASFFDRRPRMTPEQFFRAKAEAASK